MSVAIVSIPSVGNWRFRNQDKAKNAFLYIKPFLQPDTTKIRFLFDNATLYKNIISSKVNIFFR